MAFAQLNSPVVLDGIVSAEKLAELLGWQTEYHDLDYKRVIDVSSQPGLVEFAKDVGAYQVFGAYVVGGVDNRGVPTGEMDNVNASLFDEATLRPKAEKYLPGPVEIRSAVHEHDGHQLVLIYFGRHRDGYGVFHTTGQYQDANNRLRVAFRAGEIFWRNGTSSERMSQHGLEAVIQRRLAEEKVSWIEEQQEIRRRDQEALARAYEARRVGDEPLGALNFELATDELVTAALELIRRGNERIPLIHLLNDAVTRARDAIDRNEIESELAVLLDKLTCLAASFLEYEEDEWFERLVGALAKIYSAPLRDEADARRFGFSTQVAPDERAPRVWLLVIQRVFGIGALAVRYERWEAVRTLTLQLPEKLDRDYDANWLRHALTMASRAQRLGEKASLLSLARSDVERLPCLRADGVSGDDESVITSLAQFDFLSNLAAIDGEGSVDSRVFYTNFARFRQMRTQPIANRILADSELRKAIFRREDNDLAQALAVIGERGVNEGVRYDGFHGWGGTPVGEFIDANVK